MLSEELTYWNNDIICSYNFFYIMLAFLRKCFSLNFFLSIKILKAHFLGLKEDWFSNIYVVSLWWIILRNGENNETTFKSVFCGKCFTENILCTPFKQFRDSKSFFFYDNRVCPISLKTNMSIACLDLYSVQVYNVTVILQLTSWYNLLFTRCQTSFHTFWNFSTPSLLLEFDGK